MMILHRHAWIRRLAWTAVFAASLGFLEAIVVVYLRELYYPQGFNFPLTIFNERIFLTEIVRELCTLLILLAVGMVAGSTSFTRFTYFLYAFGIWDIFYYVALKLFLHWPDTLMTWDILFLIPITWIGPVLAPLLCSMAMIVLGIMAEKYRSAGMTGGFPKIGWIFIITGAVLVYISFTVDYTLLLFKGDFMGQKGNLFHNPDFIKTIGSYVPTKFSWEWFIPGYLLVSGSILSYHLSHRKWRTRWSDSQS
jgi:hypothetical protein